MTRFEPTHRVNAYSMSTITIPSLIDHHAAARTLLQDLAAEKPTGLYSRRRAIDHLLDVRSAVPERNRSFIDRILAEVPGVSVVESEWWLDQVRIITAFLDHPISS